MTAQLEIVHTSFEDQILERIHTEGLCGASWEHYTEEERERIAKEFWFGLDLIDRENNE